MHRRGFQEGENAQSDIKITFHVRAIGSDCRQLGRMTAVGNGDGSSMPVIAVKLKFGVHEATIEDIRIRVLEMSL
jgi:hypothetical protein